MVLLPSILKWSYLESSFNLLKFMIKRIPLSNLVEITIGETNSNYSWTVFFIISLSLRGILIKYLLLTFLISHLLLFSLILILGSWNRFLPIFLLVSATVRDFSLTKDFVFSFTGAHWVSLSGIILLSLTEDVCIFSCSSALFQWLSLAFE